jgi:hypothetical protein
MRPLFLFWLLIEFYILLSIPELGGYLGLFLGVSVFDLRVLMDFLPGGKRK